MELPIEEHLKTCSVCLDQAVNNYVNVLKRLAQSNLNELGTGITELRCGKTYSLIKRVQRK
jgi:hypothetical protein